MNLDVRRLTGLGGILAAAILAQLNDQVLTSALSDVQGGFGLAHDTASWLSTVYINGEVIGMIVAPSLGLGFSFRRFALFAVALSTLSTIAMPLCGSIGSLLGLRFLQGLAAGFTIPLLMTTALRVLDPPIRLYGLACYALTATFTPNLATTLAALWTDGVGDYRFIFLEALPLGVIAAVPIWWGMQQDPPNYPRLKKFDWLGAILVAVGFGALSIVLEQGDRLDWFNSPLIATLTLVSVVAIPWFVAHESFAQVPLIRIDLLKRRNFAYASITLILFLIIALSASAVPIDFLTRVQGYRPLQAQGLTLAVAASQLVLLPATALLLDVEWIDSRWVSAVGFACILGSCIGKAFLTPDWMAAQFLPWQVLDAVGFPLVAMPLLMMATNVLSAEEGPYASAMINAPRAVAEAIGVWVIAIIDRWRGGLHRTRLLETLGSARLKLAQGAPIPGAVTPALSPNGRPSSAGALEALNRGIEAAVTTLTTIDTFLILGVVVLVMMVILALLPERTYPPRIALAGD